LKRESFNAAKIGKEDDVPRKSQFSDEQIIRAIKEHESGVKAEDIARKMGVTATTFFRWKSKYGGMDVSEAKRLKQLEDENRRLKGLLADQLLDNAALKAVLGKKW
jgi:putative transposase